MTYMINPVSTLYILGSNSGSSYILLTQAINVNESPAYGMSKPSRHQIHDYLIKNTHSKNVNDNTELMNPMSSAANLGLVKNADNINMEFVEDIEYNVIKPNTLY